MAIPIDVDMHPAPGYAHHECTATRDGDWLVFLCAQCSDYERRLNWRTGETSARNSSPDINHSGRYFAAEFKESFENSN